MAFDYAIALTGGIAAGKSTVAEIFTKRGFKVIDADKISHRVLDEQYLEIVSMFGTGLVLDGKVDRRSLGILVFSDKKKREALEQLLHPLIYKEIESESNVLDELRMPYLVDIPLFFETSRYPIEKILVVHTSREQQLRQLIERNGYSEEAAMERINAQLPLDEKKAKGTYLIENTSDLAHLEKECEAVIKKINGEKWVF